MTIPFSTVKLFLLLLYIYYDSSSFNTSTVTCVTAFGLSKSSLSFTTIKGHKSIWNIDGYRAFGRHDHTLQSKYKLKRWHQLPTRHTFFSSTETNMILLGDNDITAFPILSNDVSINNNDNFLWILRIISTIVSYIGFVWYYDRPRGILNIQENIDIEIKQSSVVGAGLGVFVKSTSIEKDTILGTYPGVVIPLQQNLSKLQLFPFCEGYIWRFSDNKYVIDPTNTQGILDPVCYGGNPSLPGSIFIMTVLLRFITVSSLLCRINEPPRGMDVNVITIEDCTNRSVTFQLERTVYAGEELFIDYGLSYDRSKYGSTTGTGTK